MKSKFQNFRTSLTGSGLRFFSALALALCLLPVGAEAQGPTEPPGICPQPRLTPTAPKEYLEMKNPLEATESNLLAGKTLFHVDAVPGPCRTCHGTAGNGMGITFRQLQPKPRNFTCYATMKGLPDGQLFWIIRNGSPGTAMPAFTLLEDDQVWQLILYLRSLVKN